MRKNNENKDLFVALFSSAEAGSVVVSIAQEVVVRHQPLYGVSHHIYIQWFTLHTISTQKQKADIY